MERLETGLELSKGIKVLFGVALWISLLYALHLHLLTSVRKYQSFILRISFIEETSVLLESNDIIALFSEG
jgi:hypothetical protein